MHKFDYSSRPGVKTNEVFAQRFSVTPIPPPLEISISLQASSKEAAYAFRQAFGRLRSAANQPKYKKAVLADGFS